MDQRAQLSIELRRALEVVGEDRFEALAQVARDADRWRERKTAFTARRELATACSYAGRWDQVFPLLRQCVDDFDHRRWVADESDEQDFLTWYAELVGWMAHFPNIPLRVIDEALADTESRLRAGGHELRAWFGSRRAVAESLGDWDAERWAYEQWSTLTPADSAERPEVELGRLLARGDEESLRSAREYAIPAFARLGDWAVAARCLMLTPLVLAGEHEHAVAAYRRVRRTANSESLRFEQHGAIIEFCALTGNAASAVELLSLLPVVEQAQRPTAKLEFATAAAVLANQMIDQGRGEYRYGDSPENYFQLRTRMADLVTDLAARFDARDGDNRRGDRHHDRLTAERVVEFLPLTVASRPPEAILPSTVADCATLLDLARDFGELGEQDKAWGALITAESRLSDDEPLRTRAAELRATLSPGPETEGVLNAAAGVYQAHGQPVRHHLAKARLGLAALLSGADTEGSTLSAAVTALRGLDDPRARLWGELWLIETEVRRDDPVAVVNALRDATMFARSQGDTFMLGVFAERLASWLNDTFADPGGAIEAATSAVEHFIDHEAGRWAVRAGEQLRIAYDRSAAKLGFVAYIEGQLTRRLPESLGEFEGWLRYQRARQLIETGRGADAWDDLCVAVGQAVAHGDPAVDRWFDLAGCAYATDRFEDAIDAALSSVFELDRLRARDRRTPPHRADRCRLILAESLRHLHEFRGALVHFERLIRDQESTWDATGGACPIGPTYISALAGAGSCLLHLDVDAAAARRFRQAADAARAIDDSYLIAAHTSAEVEALFFAGDLDTAMAVLADADRAVVLAEAPEPDAGVYQHARIDRIAARLLAARGDRVQAAQRAARAAEAFRRIGEKSRATHMDILHGRILMDAGRPEHAARLLREALIDAPEDTRESIEHILAEIDRRLS